MNARIRLAASLTTAAFASILLSCAALACCPAHRSGQPVVNADQTVLMIWDAAAKTQHFIRQASFKSEADDFGFLVPTPAQPELEESGNEAFSYLRKLTEPETKRYPRPSRIQCGCSAVPPVSDDARPAVVVLQEKLVAGFDAAVLEAESANALVDWLKDHDYAYSPEVEAWAKPYVEAGWKFTALKVAKGMEDKEAKTVAASALRISFQTGRPLFPYREPDPRSDAAALDAKRRLLRIYFIAEARYQGELGEKLPWRGDVAWSNPLNATDRTKILELLKLPETTGPAEWWLTEFEHVWPYALAPSDVFFSQAADQRTVKRPPIIEYVASPPDITPYALVAIAVLPPFMRRMRRGSPLPIPRTPRT